MSALSKIYEYLKDGEIEKREFNEFCKNYQRNKQNIMKELIRIGNVYGNTNR